MRGSLTEYCKDGSEILISPGKGTIPAGSRSGLRAADELYGSCQNAGLRHRLQTVISHVTRLMKPWIPMARFIRKQSHWTRLF